MQETTGVKQPQNSKIYDLSKDLMNLYTQEPSSSDKNNNSNNQNKQKFDPLDKMMGCYNNQYNNSFQMKNPNTYYSGNLPNFNNNIYMTNPTINTLNVNMPSSGYNMGMNNMGMNNMRMNYNMGMNYNMNNQNLYNQQQNYNNGALNMNFLPKSNNSNFNSSQSYSNNYNNNNNSNKPKKEDAFDGLVNLK